MGFGPGQHSLLYFPKSGWILESHTFGVAAGWGAAAIDAPNAATLVSPTDESKKEAVVSLIEPRNHDFTSVNFLIRAHGGATAWPKHQIASSSSRTIMTSVLTEEPYGDHHATR
ncbi:putative ferric reductase like transmembrane component [Colletotrichum tofieldiae]|nr:putative ferric reductase like transmembrane component [Colletotrichum tofieldiae]GKT72675.1 putative ferric reductase like transmembrane component [Colletotrichum tofieldiae]